MTQLIQELRAGTPYYGIKEDGGQEVFMRAPTKLMLQAANEIERLMNVVAGLTGANDSLTLNYSSIYNNYSDALETCGQLTKELNELKSTKLVDAPAGEENVSGTGTGATSSTDSTE